MLHAPPVLRMVRDGSQSPNVAVVPVLHPVESHLIETTTVPRSREAVFRFPRERAPRRHPWLRFDSVSAKSPAYSDKMQAKSGTAGGRVCSIARRFVSAVSLVVYKVRQFGGNYMQSAARQQLLEESSVYGRRRGPGGLTTTNLSRNRQLETHRSGGLRSHARRALRLLSRRLAATSGGGNSTAGPWSRAWE